MKRLILSAVLALTIVGTASAQTGLGAFGSGSINPNAAVSANATIDVLTTVIQQLTVTGGTRLRLRHQ